MNPCHDRQSTDEESHRLSMTVLMTPEMANFAGNVHGGAVLKLADQVAYACASRYAGRYVVTLSVDQVLFKQTVHVGELVTLRAAVNYVGRSSISERAPAGSGRGSRYRLSRGAFIACRACRSPLLPS